MRKRQKTIDELVGRHPGSTMLVIGNSSSLNELDLTLFDYFLSIGVNRLLRLYCPTYLYAGDKSVTRVEEDRMVCYADDVCLILHPAGLTAELRKRLQGRFLYSGDMRGGANPVAKAGMIDIGPVGNSGYQATQMAYRMGATKILLAGIDLFWPRVAPSHFFGRGSEERCRLVKAPEIVQAFGRLKDLYSQKGVSLASVSTWKTPLRRTLGYVPLDKAAHDAIQNAAGRIRATDL